MVAVAALSGFAFPPGLAAEDAMMAYDEQPRFDEDSIESRVQAAVIEALMLYWDNGAGAFDMIAPEDISHTDMIYPFVLNATTLETVANGAYLDFAGAIPDTLTAADRPLERIMADMHRDGGTWVEYMASNPDNGLIQLKRSWLYLHGGYIFGSGHYLPESQVKYVVEDAVRLFESRGVEAFDIITPDAEVEIPTHLIDREEGRDAGLGANVVVHTADLYPFVLNATDWSTVAHATIPSRVGTCCSYAIQHGGDRPIEVIIEDLHRDKGTWVEYVFINPATDTKQLKRAWLYLHGDYIFGSGYYLQDSRVQSLVDEAIHLYAARGTDAFDAITPETTDILVLQSPFVLHGTTLEVVAHGIFPNLVNTTDQHLGEADRSMERIINELQTQEGAWVWYMSRSAGTQTDQLTRTYLSMYDGYIFGAGYSMPDSRVQSVVDQAVYTYKSDGDAAAFTEINSGAMNDLDIYPLVRDNTNIYAHGTLPDLIGPLPQATLARSYEASWNAAVEGGGVVWSESGNVSIDA